MCHMHTFTHIGGAASRGEILLKDRMSVPASVEDLRGKEDEGADRYAAHHTRWHTNAHNHRMAIHQTTPAVVKCS